ncbi:MAG TPA: adenylate/guanylate cyclase domain-containing protein [Actinoplanes sp.]|nr:adenylate/guanylate cyclase domain-containing protein [Actinoplanes sp.]
MLFVDIVEATPLALSLGDRAWAELLEQYHQLVRETLERHRGWLMDTAGDGFFAIFDETDDAIRGALDIRESVRPLGLELRAGVHLGHCWKAGAKCAGADVHVGARLAGAADPGEVLISEAAAERAGQAGLELTDRGIRSLKGMPGTRRVFAVGTKQPAAVLGPRPSALGQATPDAPSWAPSTTRLTNRHLSIYLWTSMHEVRG